MQFLEMLNVFFLEGFVICEMGLVFQLKIFLKIVVMINEKFCYIQFCVDDEIINKLINIDWIFYIKYIGELFEIR